MNNALERVWKHEANVYEPTKSKAKLTARFAPSFFGRAGQSSTMDLGGMDALGRAFPFFGMTGVVGLDGLTAVGAGRGGHLKLRFR